MNNQTFQKAFDHFIALSEEPESLYYQVFRTLVEERSRYLELYNKFEGLVMQAGRAREDFQQTIASRDQTIASREQMLADQALELMGLREEIAGYKAREDMLKVLEQASRSSSSNETARAKGLEQQIAVLREDLDRAERIARGSESDLQVMLNSANNHIKNLETEMSRLDASVDKMHEDLSGLEDEKAVLEQKLRDAQQRILELLNQSVPRLPGRFPNGE